MIKERPTSKTWTSRRGLAWVLRLSTVVVPLVLALVAMIGAAHLVPRPRGGLLLVGWYLLLLAVSWLASWATGKVMDRTLPLAALLEMTLTFPESAPSRLGLAQRNGSAAELTRLATAPPDETTQDAAERILRLLSALSAHDRFTRGHAERVRAYTDLIADKMGLPAAERERLRWAALLHDIGKLRVPSTLLNKPGKPTAAEWEALQQHPIHGSEIAAPLLAWLQPMDRVIAEHHEKFDGSGYPVGLAGEAISQGARIVTVADCFEAMTAVRSYSKPMKRDVALAELVACAGSHFDPIVVRALLAVPHRRLQWAMGPTAWLAGLPIVGQGSIGALRTAVGHAGTTAIGATAVVVAAVAPSTLFGTAQASPPPPPQLEAAAQTAVPSAAAATVGAPAPTSAGPQPAQSSAAAPTTTTPRQTPKPTAAPTAKPTPGKTPSPAVTTTTKPTRTSSVAVPTTTSPTTTGTTTTTAAPTTTARPVTTRTSAPTTAPTTTPAPTHPTVAPTTAAPTTHPTAAPTTTRPTTTPPPGTTTTAPTTAPTTTAPTTAAPTTAATQSGPAKCTATYSASGTPDQLKATITVKNTGSTVGTGWTVTWSWASGEQKVTSATNATVTQSGKNVTANNGLLGVLGSLLPGISSTFTIKGDGKQVSPVPTLTCVLH